MCLSIHTSNSTNYEMPSGFKMVSIWVGNKHLYVYIAFHCSWLDNLVLIRCGGLTKFSREHWMWINLQLKIGLCHCFIQLTRTYSKIQIYREVQLLFQLLNKYLKGTQCPHELWLKVNIYCWQLHHTEFIRKRLNGNWGFWKPLQLICSLEVDHCENLKFMIFKDSTEYL